jgi:hypothetical protein
MRRVARQESGQAGDGETAGQRMVTGRAEEGQIAFHGKKEGGNWFIRDEFTIWRSRQKSTTKQYARAGSLKQQLFHQIIARQFI